MAVRVPSDATISRSGVRVVPLPLATVVFHGFIDLTISVPRVTNTIISSCAIALSSGLVVKTTGVKRSVFFLLATLADSWRILVYLWLVYITVTKSVALRPSTAVTLFFALIVPRNTALMVSVGVGHARSVISVLEFAYVSGQALVVLNAKFWNIVGRLDCVVVVASSPSVALWRV
jgi:hypothetical protein